MRKKSVMSTIWICSALLFLSFLFSSCKSMITPEQLAKLRDLRKEESSLNADIASKKQEKAGLERELSSRKADVKKCTDEKDMIKAKLSQWPNVWPDWKPEVPQQQNQ